MLNRTVVAVLSATVLAVLAAPVMAQAGSSRMYKCVDAKGKIYYTQVPPRECLGKDTDVLSGQGQVVRRIDAPPTPEERAAAEAGRQKKREQEMAAREERRRAQALLNTYSSEKEIEEARARALKDNEGAIADIEKRIAAAEKRAKQFVNEKEFYAKGKLPPKLQDSIRDNELEIKTQRDLLRAKKKQVSEINGRYDDDKRRFIELTKGGTARSAAAKK